jgi:hypothetical protein
MEWNEVLTQALFYSAINFGLLFPVLLFVTNAKNQDAQAFLYWLAILSLLILGPVAWPFLLRKLFRWKWLARHIQLPYPTSWDFFFDKREPVFLLFRLTDGSMLGGLWSGRSYAASFPNDGDIYLEAVYSLTPSGAFIEPVPESKGALLRRDQYVAVEIFAIAESEEAKDVEAKRERVEQQGRISAPERGILGED